MPSFSGGGLTPCSRRCARCRFALPSGRLVAWGVFEPGVGQLQPACGFSILQLAVMDATGDRARLVLEQEETIPA